MLHGKSIGLTKLNLALKNNKTANLVNMKKEFPVYWIILFGLLFVSWTNSKQPIVLHPENPHYFLFRGKPTVLIGSTEHYGAVLNLDFDYKKYFDELESEGLNVTRTFTGIYVEPQGAFGIAKNTLAPQNERFICPWARSNQPGYAGGGNKFDLNTWDEAYFSRLRDFVAEAGKRNIVVELDLFSNFYDTIQWKLSPIHYNNNINEVKVINDHKEILSLRHPEILKLQERMVEKILTELNAFDNLYYEICNEPYFGDVAALEAWQNYMTNVVAEIEKKLPVQHLISQNVANGYRKIENPHPAVSIFNFHYAKPPNAVELNYDLNKPIGDNETGFDGIEDVHYRTEAWNFMTAGGALYNNLDYSFTVGHEDGSFLIVPGQPGGGGVQLRNQLKLLKEVFTEMDFIRMKPANHLVDRPHDFSSIRILADEGKQYLLYINNAKSREFNYSLRYTAKLNVPVSGQYWFYTLSDDGVKLSIDGKELIKNWTNHGATRDSAIIELVAGKRYAFELEYYQASGGATLSLEWKVPGKNNGMIPSSAFSAPQTSGPGLLAEKFDGIELQNKKNEKIVTKINAAGISSDIAVNHTSSEVSILLPKGSYSGEWINTKTGDRIGFDIIDHNGGPAILEIPLFSEDLALLIKHI